jgi:hypothetical protein
MSETIERIAQAMLDNPGSTELIQGEAEHLARVALKATAEFLSGSHNSSLAYAGDALTASLDKAGAR